MVHANPDPDNDFEIDLSDISDLSNLDIEIDVEADEPLPLYYFWRAGGSSRTSTDESRRIYDISEFARVYPGNRDSEIEVSAVYAECCNDMIEYYSTDDITLTMSYNLAGDAEPAQCLGITIDGDTNPEDNLYKVGQTVTLQVRAHDPKSLPVEIALVRFGVDGDYEDAWITEFKDNRAVYVPIETVIHYTFTEQDVKDNFTIRALCRNNDGFGIYRDESSEDSIVSVPIRVSM